MPAAAPAIINRDDPMIWMTAQVIGRGAKQCRRCLFVRPASSYHVNRESADGLQYRCKQCFAEYDKERHAQPHRKERYKAYAQTATGKESKRIRSARYRAKMRTLKESRS